jgi:hypothetical protein
MRNKRNQLDNHNIISVNDTNYNGWEHKYDSLEEWIPSLEGCTGHEFVKHIENYDISISEPDGEDSWYKLEITKDGRRYIFQDGSYNDKIKDMFLGVSGGIDNTDSHDSWLADITPDVNDYNQIREDSLTKFARKYPYYVFFVRLWRRIFPYHYEDIEHETDDQMIKQFVLEQNRGINNVDIKVKEIANFLNPLNRFYRYISGCSDIPSCDVSSGIYIYPD